ncbi:MAG: lipopolysaccharide heptosyltransferase II, partial [Planctomycetota bacterium]
MQKDNILIWLPSPMGDAILTTPALRAIHSHLSGAEITFMAEPIVHQVLYPCDFNNNWLEPATSNPFALAKILKHNSFTHAILFKNSFASALAVFLAKISVRIGYARDGRGFLLTEKLHPKKLYLRKFKPLSMVDYYLAIASWIGADTTDRTVELSCEPAQLEALKSKLPQLFTGKGPLVVLVPGGAFGPSKCWPAENYAKTADRLIAKYNAKVVVSVSPEAFEKKIAESICSNSTNELISLADSPMTLGQLKALLSKADLVITNDTGPRHIAIALGRKIITLFGPNDPAWTDTASKNEIQIVGRAPCSPCQKPVCKKSEHLCMEAISVDTVCREAEKLISPEQGKQINPDIRRLIEVDNSFFIDPDFQAGLAQMGLLTIDDVFSFAGGENLKKANLAEHRTRIKFQMKSPAATLFLKRYDRPPVLAQLKNFLSAGKRCCMASTDYTPARQLAAQRINTPETIAYGCQWGKFFEKRSYIITKEIPNAQSLEKSLPEFCTSYCDTAGLCEKRQFLNQLAEFIKKFHATGYRHRDLYFSHIFYDRDGNFHLIDLARAFKPRFRPSRFKLKDIAQLCYSAPEKYFSATDRLRFYLKYTASKKLTAKDKTFIRKVMKKT